MTDAKLPTDLWTGLALIVLAFLLLIGLLTYQALDRAPEISRSRELVVHTFEVITTAQALDRAIRDAERGQHGFLISGEVRYLEPYQAGVRNMPPLLAKLMHLTAGNAAEQRLLQTLKTQLDIKLAEIQQTVQVREHDGFNAAQQIVRTDGGFNAMRLIEESLDGTIAAENRLLSERLLRLGETERSSARTALASGLLAVLTMLLGLLYAILALRNARRIDLARRASEQRFGLLVDGAADHAMYLLDAAGHITDWNSGAERLTGYRADEIVGQHFSRFYADEERRLDEPRRALEVALSGKYEAEGWRLRKDGTRFYASVVINALFDASGRQVGFAKITRDITARLQQQQTLEQTRAALAQAQKMEALGQLSGGIAHDFNNLLHVIKNATELLQRCLSGAEEDVRRYLEMIKRNAERAASVTQRLLAFSRRQPLDPKPLDVNKLVAGMADLLRHALGEQMELESVLASEAWPVSVDANQLETAILNLAVNARDAMPGSGKLTIETANVLLDESYAAMYEKVRAGQYVMIAVSDTGTGMTPEIVAKAFDPFFTTKEMGQGTGLGLSQVFGFVKQSGGHVKIYSEPGKGTTVKLYLPRLEGAPGQFLSAEPRSFALARASESILVVEDDADVRSFTAEILRELGYRVRVAADAHLALAALDADEEVQLLLTDVGLPNGMNGRELADQVTQRWPAVKILFMTGYAQSAIVHDGRLDPGVELILKPFTQASLAEKVRRVLDGSPCE